MIQGAAPSPVAAIDPVKAKQLEKLKGAAQAFEAVFMRQMIKSMRAASLGDDIMGSDAANQFRDMSDSKLADDMAGRNTFGIAQMLLKQFSGQVTGATDPTAAVSKASAAANAPAPVAPPLPGGGGS